ncbi:MAG: serine/threonine protein kinase [Blastocatellales bacterium]|nr:serine/threonine protein kinase [Blastocatellales bacterium]
MTPERWQQIKRLFHSALELEPQNRRAYVDTACGDDEDLRREVDTLLSTEDDLDDFITTPVIEDAAGIIAAAQQKHQSKVSDSSSMTDRRIGPYEITREIGRGGMGAVYLAQRADEQFKQKVAIKLIHGGHDSDFITNRFKHERQILASFDHPNIARLLDGGATEDGRLYLVMEYIEGEPLDLYCDRRSLPTRDRIELFRRICSAVHYAHQNLVVHRDLKPGNILVTSDGTPKLLDFGIAKLLDPALYAASSDPTLAGIRLMTPAYASPEQIRSAPISTASDIYSLGVILYELLTGHRPYRVKSLLPGELERAICEIDPERPSTAIRRVIDTEANEADSTGAEPSSITPELVSRRRGSEPDRLHRVLAGDLDNIVLMALRKEPSRRYASVEQFSEDLRRYLDGLPVIARQNSFGYRMEKFIHRNRLAVAAAALVVVSLVGGIIATGWQARAAQRERARAERRLKDVRELAGSFLFEFHDEVVNLPGSTAVREKVVVRALEYLDRLAQETGKDPALSRELAVGYLRLGDAQGNPAYANRGDLNAALESYRKSLELLESSNRLEPNNPATQRFIGIANERIGEVLILTGNLTEAQNRYSTTLRIREAALAADPESLRALREIGISYERMGDLFYQRLDTNAAIESHRKGFDVGARLLASSPDDRLARRDMAIGHDRLGNLLVETGDLDRALSEYRKAESIRARLLEEDATNTEHRRDLAISWNKIGAVLLKMGDADEALAAFRSGLKLSESIAGPDPLNAQARQDVALGKTLLGKALLALGDNAAALGALREASAIYRDLSANGKENSGLLGDLALADDLSGTVLARLRDRAAAAAAHERAGAMFEKLAGDDPDAKLAKRDYAIHLNRFGESLVELHDGARADSRFQSAAAILAPMSERDSGNSETRIALAAAFAGIGRCRAMAGDPHRAGVHLADARAQLEPVVAREPLHAAAQQRLANITADLGRVLAGQLRWDEAERAFRRSLDLWVALRDRGQLRGDQNQQPRRIERELSRVEKLIQTAR